MSKTVKRKARLIRAFLLRSNIKAVKLRHTPPLLVSLPPLF